MSEPLVDLREGEMMAQQASEPLNELWVHQAHFEWRNGQLAALDGDGHIVGMFTTPDIFVYKRGRRVVIIRIKEAQKEFGKIAQ